MYLLPPNLRFLLAASCCVLVVLGAAIGVAVVAGQTELVALSAMALIAVAIGSFLLMGWQMAQLLRAQGRLLDRVTGRLTVFDQEAESQEDVKKGPSFPSEGSQIPFLQSEPSTARKIEAFSHLWDGIVHDLNNRFTVINANVETAARQLKDQPALQRKLLSALVATDQAASLIARSSSFARDRQTKISFVDPADRIDSIATLLSRSLLRDTVELRLNLENGLWGIQVDASDLEAAIVTLCSNLRGTLGQGGTITIEAQNVTVSKGMLSRTELEGDFVRIAIGTNSPHEAPNGSGGRSETVFSMQDMDLASWVEFNQSLHFLRPIGGMAEVVTLGAKSVVALYIPRAAVPDHITRSVSRDEDGIGEKTSIHTEILVVDDEIEVALALQAMLEELGYVARIATNAGQIAKTLKARKPGLLLCDVTMPGPASGLTLAREARQIYPDLPILLITANPVATGQESEFPLLQKPVASRKLHAAIQKQLALNSGKVVSLFPRPTRRAN